jgi:aminodeoxyfutalosine deaminase
MFLTAPLIHNGYEFLPEGSVIELADDGTIIGITSKAGKDVFEYPGILSPGLVNVHCHLELSHLKGVLPEHTGLIPFLQPIPQIRGKFSDEEKRISRHKGYEELVRNGVVAVGDICNLNDTLDLRSRDELHYHSFVEVLGFTDTYADKVFNDSRIVYESFVNQPDSGKRLRQSIVPHAPYTVSSTLFRLIDQFDISSVISIHNQESEEENRYYISKEGGVKELLKTFGIDDSFFVPSGKSSIETYSEWLSEDHRMIFVHNTYTKADELQRINSRYKNAFWCLCPNANLYIENALPDIPMMVRENATICIGTDSLSSNHELCIASELYSIKKAFPEIEWETLLTWATLSGAMALQMEDIIGSISPGKKPGIVNITNLEGKPQVSRILITDLSEKF